MNEYTISTIHVGMKESFSKQITKEMEDSFRFLSGDDNPLHQDDSFVQEIGKGKFKSHVTYGMLTASLYSTMAGMYLPGKYSLIHSFEELSFKKPVYVGDMLTTFGEVIEKNANLNLIQLKISIRNQKGELVSKGKMKILLLK